MEGLARNARLVWRVWIFTLRSFLASEFFILTAILQPVIFASIAFFLFRAGGANAGEQTLLFAALGTGMMGVWSTTLFGCGGAIQWHRWEGTLELLVAAPSRYDMVLLGQTLGAATFGFYSIVATLIWGMVLFGMPLNAAYPLLLPVALAVAIVSLGCLGMLLATSFVLYRHANALSNLLEYPIWIVTGMVVPLAALPGWLGPISWVLVPTWAMEAIRGSAMGASPPLLAIGICLVLATVYYLLARRVLRYVLDKARRDATLALA
ncbi:MAG TPA: ABC transporter permease [candidate division Zixibacteria bacterium]|nr:ABC transporter permease [candidate division Zixibacteria bacterium]